jgi:hypothetical protein
MHFVGRKPVFNSEILAEIAAGRLARVKSEPTARGDHDDDSTNRSRLKPEFSLHTAARADLWDAGKRDSVVQVRLYKIVHIPSLARL